MIDKIHRFQGYGSLRFVYAKGQIVRGQFMSLKYVFNKRRETYRIAVVVSRKVHKSAVVRNRIRRRIYEIVRTQARIGKPFDIVLTVYNDQVATIPADQLRTMILQQLQKAAVITDVQPAAASGQHAIVEPKESA